MQQYLQRKPDVQQHRVRVAALPYNSKNYEFGRWLNGGGSDASGTITVAFAQITSQAYLQVVQLSGNDASNPIAQSAYASSGSGTTQSSPYTANLPAPPLAGTNYDLYFLDASEDLGSSAPTGTPAVTNLIYVKAGSGTAGTYFAGTPSQNESFAGPTNTGGRSRSKSSARDHRQHKYFSLNRPDSP